MNKKKIPTNLLAAHHPLWLIVEVANSMEEEHHRPNPILTVKMINDRLQKKKGAEQLRVVNVKWNVNGNCIISLRANQSAVSLIPHVESFADIIAGNKEYHARADQPWYKIQLNGVWTAKNDGERYDDENNFYLPTPEELHQELHDNNSDYAQMTILQKPRWIKPAQELSAKLYLLIVFAVASKEDANLIVKKL